MFLLSCNCPPHQLFLQVYGPDDSVMSHGEYEEEEESQLSVAHPPHSSVVKDWLSPIRKSVDQDVVIPADAYKLYLYNRNYKLAGCQSQEVELRCRGTMISHRGLGTRCRGVALPSDWLTAVLTCVVSPRLSGLHK